MGAASTPKTDPNQPHWKMATTTPYADPIDSTFMITALSGTRIDRNTIIRSRNDTPSTAAKKTMIRPAR